MQISEGNRANEIPLIVIRRPQVKRQAVKHSREWNDTNSRESERAFDYLCLIVVLRRIKMLILEFKSLGNIMTRCDRCRVTNDSTARSEAIIRKFLSKTRFNFTDNFLRIL